ncbi:hypothetical protein GXP67_34040 [Rhodocytophaga rosea]|uniref:Uncharacterized protein n=1 Tax=Rhodocytophaga rosea TaxID=2704465 RepID=A0A6C0GVH7_9BACT|nr:hypothetical protein [Rhodocytophaga rosea]QHT71322.1 hypothetical protein GXP67_34040 [Rhodocytophaga rosea]
MNNWIKYTGEHDKQYYDLKLKTGRLVAHCWPYKGIFNPVNRSNEWPIEGWRIDEIRVCEMQKNFPTTPTEG